VKKPFVDVLHFKNNSTDSISHKMSEKVRRKKIMENISKKSAEKIPKSCKIWGKNPRILRKIAGIF
jgi:hypothetical protein